MDSTEVENLRKECEAAKKKAQENLQKYFKESDRLKAIIDEMQGRFFFSYCQVLSFLVVVQPWWFSLDDRAWSAKTGSLAHTDVSLLSYCQWCLVTKQCFVTNSVVKAACEAGARGEGEKHARERAIYAGERMPFRSDVQLKGSLKWFLSPRIRGWRITSNVALKRNHF